MIYHVYMGDRFLFDISKEAFDSYTNPALVEHCKSLFEEQMRQDLEEINI